MTTGMFLPSMLKRGSYIPGPHDSYTARCAGVMAAESETILPTFRSRFGQPSRRCPMPVANELSTVEWQSAHVMPTLVRLLLASTLPITPTTAPSLSSVTVVAGLLRSTVLFCSPVFTAAGSASTSTLRPTDKAVAGLTELRITSCIFSESVQNDSSPYVSSRKIVRPDAVAADFTGPALAVGFARCADTVEQGFTESSA